MSEPITECFQCQGCNKFYDELDAAEACCLPDMFWRCANCGTPYFDSDLAKECCTGDE